MSIVFIFLLKLTEYAINTLVRLVLVDSISCSSAAQPFTYKSQSHTMHINNSNQYWKCFRAWTGVQGRGQAGHVPRNLPMLKKQEQQRVALGTRKRHVVSGPQVASDAGRIVPRHLRWPRSCTTEGSRRDDRQMDTHTRYIHHMMIYKVHIVAVGTKPRN